MYHHIVVVRSSPHIFHQSFDVVNNNKRLFSFVCISKDLVDAIDTAICVNSNISFRCNYFHIGKGRIFSKMTGQRSLSSSRLSDQQHRINLLGTLQGKSAELIQHLHDEYILLPIINKLTPHIHLKVLLIHSESRSNLRDCLDKVVSLHQSPSFDLKFSSKVHNIVSFGHGK